ncbi:MAG TPA: ATP-binding protein [Bryobacteraceae bacterium]|nr:ATP-binding protein [Bryobacteraceae bacterium]
MSVSVSPFHQPADGAHFLQFYRGDEEALNRNVTDYLWTAWKRGEGLLVVASHDHLDKFVARLRRLGIETADAIRRGLLVLLGAEQTLAQFMVDGSPDAERFDRTVGATVRAVKARAGGTGVSAYGEMVGVLWIAGQFEAAVRLEELWNHALRDSGIKLFCGYPIDILGKEFENPAVDALLCAHTHLVPSGAEGDLDRAITRATREYACTDILDDPVLSQCGAPIALLPTAESRILRLRQTLDGGADEILAKIRHYYEGEKRFRALVENGSDGVSLLDDSGRISYASAPTAKILGYSPADFIARNALEFIHHESSEQACEAFERALHVLEPIAIQLQARHQDGGWRWLEVTFSNLLDEPHVRAIVVNFRDISEQKSAQEKMQRDTEALARSNAELQAFAYAVSHDLKEPLRTVCAFTQLLVQDEQLGEQGKQYAAFVVDGVKRMSALLDDLLSFASLNSKTPPELVNLRNAAEAAIQNLEQSIREADATITVGEMPQVRGKESHLVLLFQNLIGNAIKYHGDQPPRVDLAADRFGLGWVVKVSDNGVGIPPEYQDQVFGLFKRLQTGSVDGTGIGLAMCKKIVEGMGGRIWVESEPGRGSTFCFTVAQV